MTALHRWIITVIRALAAIAERRRQRRALARLDDRLLRDIGITRNDVKHEIKKRF